MGGSRVNAVSGKTPKDDETQVANRKMAVDLDVKRPGPLCGIRRAQLREPQVYGPSLIIYRFEANSLDALILFGLRGAASIWDRLK